MYLATMERKGVRAGREQREGRSKPESRKTTWLLLQKQTDWLPNPYLWKGETSRFLKSGLLWALGSPFLPGPGA